MASQDSSSSYNPDPDSYQDEIVEGEQEDLYLEGEEYAEDFEEEDYGQYPGGNIIQANEEEVDSSQDYSNSFIEEPVSHQNRKTNFSIQKPQMYRVKREEDSLVQPQFNKFVKTSTPVLREDKHLMQAHQQIRHPSSQAYHIPQQHSVQYGYETQSTASTQGDTTKHHQPFSFTQKHFEMKPMKAAKRKAIAGQRKPCNCTKSMCLKLYCDCFANGEFCKDCNCKDCRNNLEFEADRTKAIKQSLERNPNAFKPKIGVSKAGTQQDVERLHQKGCHCKKSGCLKNYCECYEAKVPCTDRCKCKGCQNTETDRAVRFKDKIPGSSLLGTLAAGILPGPSSHPPKIRTANESDSDTDNEPSSTDPRGYPWFYMTDEVIDAAAMCMIAQAEEALTKDEKPTSEEMERLVLREFGRCLEQIINSTSAPPAV